MELEERSRQKAEDKERKMVSVSGLISILLGDAKCFAIEIQAEENEGKIEAPDKKSHTSREG